MRSERSGNVRTNKKGVRIVAIVVVGVLAVLMLVHIMVHHHEMHPKTHHNSHTRSGPVRLHHSLSRTRSSEHTPHLTPAAARPAPTPSARRGHHPPIKVQGRMSESGEKMYRVIESDVLRDDPELEFLHPHSYKLNSSFVENVALDNVVVVSWVNFALLDFALNWVANCKQAGIKNYMVGAMDGQALAALVQAGIPTFAMEGVDAETTEWEKRHKDDIGRHDRFYQMGREKIHLIGTFVDMGYDLVLSDIDTVWLRDPMPYFAKYPEADILCSSDATAPTTTDGGLESPQAAHSALNIGVMFVRSTSNSKHLAAKWLKLLLSDDTIWDQNGFNMYVRQNLHTHHKVPESSTADGEVKACKTCAEILPNRVFYIMNGGAKLGILPVIQFAGGHHYFVARIPQSRDVVPYVVHATFQFSGVEGKRHRLREAMLWHDPPEYYDHPRGYLTYTPYVPSDLVKYFQTWSMPNEVLDKQRHLETLQKHFALLNIQIRQLRQAVHVAQALGRVLILPKLLCGLDRWWAPHSGRTPGAPMELPFVCPFDHVFDLVKWYHPGSLDFTFREYSFLQNPRTPKQVVRSRGSAYFCGENVYLPEQGKPVDMNGRVVCEPLEPEDGTRAFMSVHAEGVHNKVARSMTARVAGLKVLEIAPMAVEECILWEHPSDRQEIDTWFEYSGSSWCCVQPPFNTSIGHVHYDLLPERIGTVDRHGFRRTGVMTINLGP